MRLGISLTNENLLKTCLRVTYHDAHRQAHTDMRELSYPMQPQRRDIRQITDNRSMLMMHRRCMGYYEALQYDGRETKMESLVVSELVGLRKAAEGESGARFSYGCIAVPPCYFDLQRHAAREAAQQCGLAEVALINEPVALLKQRPASGKIVVACLDDSVFYISVLERRGEEIIELASGGAPRWGGLELLEVLAQQAVRQKEWSLRSTKSEQWQWGIQAAYDAVYRLIEYGEMTLEFQRPITAYIQAAQQKAGAEIQRALETAGIAPGDVTLCLQIGTYWRLPGLDMPFDLLTAARREVVAPHEIAAGALIVAEERFADTVNVQGSQATALPGAAADGKGAPAPPPPQSMPISGSPTGELSPTALELPRRAWSTLAQPTASGDSPPATSPVAPVPYAEGNLPGERPPSYHERLSGEPLTVEELTASARRSVEPLAPRPAVAFYKDLIEKLSLASAELCLAEAEKARIAGEISVSLYFLREGFHLSQMESIRRRLVDACCSEAEKKERDPDRLEEALEFAREALTYDPLHERARKLKGRLEFQKMRSGSYRKRRLH